MNTVDNMKKLILEHHAIINYVPDFKTWKYHEIVWEWWEALAYYEMHNHYTSFDKAPDGLRTIHVTEDDVINTYEWVDGKYVYLQQWTKKFCRDVYGDRVPGTY